MACEPACNLAASIEVYKATVGHNGQVLTLLEVFEQKSTFTCSSLWQTVQCLKAAEQQVSQHNFLFNAGSVCQIHAKKQRSQMMRFQSFCHKGSNVFNWLRSIRKTFPCCCYSVPQCNTCPETESL